MAVLAVVAAIGLAGLNRARHEVLSPVIVFTRNSVIHEKEIIGSNIVWRASEVDDYTGEISSGRVKGGTVTISSASQKRSGPVAPIKSDSAGWGGQLNITPKSEHYLALVEQQLKAHQKVKIPHNYRFPLKPIDIAKYKQAVIFAHATALDCAGNLSFYDGLGRRHQIAFDGYVYTDLMFEAVDQKTGKSLDKKLIKINELP